MRLSELKEGMFLIDTKGISVRIDEILLMNDGFNLIHSIVVSTEYEERRKRFSVFSYETLKDHGYEIDKTRTLLYTKE